ncbi:acyl-CoA dehydrogenase family protein [Actinokineospora globicatena]|uniref:acyl-CoA dehydrogenase family protein n=1 Tax=Actinokineospora globicatena TaxID=103729 RepID=UPI0020A55E13|nr:acyl-CoA dehydrogenase family protein [Actinokineospora globicatena]MCP2303346.1 Acyl-CoA dehydrogenase [Actinokineospora globicatena]GLW79521.1 acyl-CoA dehydrogenase [Actinokineospora globicatena]GLW86069.1 acyl-CoA dehydrogenase [Actinokineospora globicatena]
MVDFTLDPHQQDIVDQARAAAKRILAPRAAEHDRTGEFPAANFTDLADTGLLGLLIPSEHGGVGADMVGYALAIAELAEACGSTALILAMHCGATRLLAAAGDETSREVLTGVLTRGELISWGFSEPGTGGNILNPRLRAVPHEGGFGLIGTKAFCTGAGHVDHYLVNTNSGEPDFRRAQSMFLLPADTPGLTVKETWDAMGMRANSANTVLLDCSVPDRLCVGGPGGGMPLLGHALPALVLGLAAASLGVARAAYGFATTHVGARVHADTGANLAAYQGVRFQVAEMTTTVHAAHLALLHAAATAEADPMEALPAMNMAKYLCNTAAIAVADTAMQVTGGQGFLRSNPMERHYRDARAGAVMGANLGALRDLIGKAALGMDIRST